MNRLSRFKREEGRHTLGLDIAHDLEAAPTVRPLILTAA
jgi:hypothetical protein